ncbi:MAG: hypothetical protein ACN6I6_00645 [bacterium]
MKTINMALMLGMSLLIACGDGEQKLVEKTQVQAQESINAENQNLERRAAALNSDLVKQQSFIAAISGEYEGAITDEGEVWNIKLRLVPTMPIFDYNRVRTMAELEYELQNQQINVQVLQWDPSLQVSSVGCIFENIRPDFRSGKIEIFSQGCPNTYQITLQDGVDRNRVTGATVATLINEGRIDLVRSLQGRLQSNGNATSVFFSLERNDL